MKNIIPNKEDKYIVISRSIITSFDRKVLTRLYQPIIGSIAFSLYLSMLSELEFDRTISTDSRPHSSLLKMTKMTLDDLVLATGKLEGVGLIKTKLNKTNNLFSYSLFAPKNPEDFFNSPLLDNQFRTALSEEDYLRNKMYFSQPNIKEEEFEDISQSFNDVYNINNEACFEVADNQINSQKAELNISFDFDLFYKKLREFQISKAVITAELKSLIPSLALAHKIAAVDMASLIHRALDNTGKVSVNKLKELCHHNTFVEVKKTKSVDYGNKQLNDLIELYNSKHPCELLVMRNNNTEIATSDRKIIDSLISDYRLPNSVINALIDYTLEVTGNRFSKNYVEKVASSLARARVEDAIGAIRFLRGSNRPSKIDTFEVNEEIKPVKVEEDNSDLDADIAESLRIIEELNKERENNG